MTIIRSTSARPRKIHRLTGTWRYIFMGIAVIYLLLAAGILFYAIVAGEAGDWRDRRDATRVLLQCAPIAGVLIFMLIHNRIVTSPEGIDYYGVGFHIFTPWDNIIDLRMAGRHKNIEALALREPGVVTGFGAWWTRQMGQDRYIPLHGFEHWPIGELADEIKHYLPNINTLPKY